MTSWMPLRVRWEDDDGHRVLVRLAVGGLLLGGAMALFGLPPVDLHGPLHYVGIMDPLCGGTRSVYSAMSGDPTMSWRYNPIGIPIVAGAVAVLLRYVAGLTTGRWLNVRVVNRWSFWVIVALLLGLLETNQQLHAELLRTSPTPSSFLGPLAGSAFGVAAYLMVRRYERSQPHAPTGVNDGPLKSVHLASSLVGGHAAPGASCSPVSRDLLVTINAVASRDRPIR